MVRLKKLTFLHSIKTEPKVLIFDKDCIVKNNFHMYKKLININDIDIKIIVLYKKDSYGNKAAFKYFIGYDDHEIGIIPLYIILPQINAYTKCFKEIKCVNFLVNDKKVLQKYNKIWDKAKSLFKEKFISEPVYKGKFIKTKVNFYNTPFLCKKMPKENECYTCVSILLLDSVINIAKKYYPQVFLQEVFKK